MGVIYAFQSPVHGQCGTTASMVAMAYAIKQEKKSIVLVHSQSSLAALENFFVSRMEQRPVYDGIGLDSLCYTIKARDLEKEDLDRAMIHLADDFFLLPSAAKRMDSEREEILQYIITEKLPLYYDYVFVDVGFGNSDVAEAIKTSADLNVIVITQNSMILKDDLPEEKVLLLCGNYNPKRKLNLRSIKQKYPKHRVYAIPYCTEYADAISDNRVHRFFKANEKLTISKKLAKTEETIYFFQELSKLQEVTHT